MLGLSILIFAASAAQAPAQAEQRRAAEEILRELLAEDDRVGFFRDGRGHERLILDSRARASDQSGICERDVLVVERAPVGASRPEGSAAIRSIKSEPWYFVVTDADERPSWALAGDALERACAAITPYQARWFTAPDARRAKSAVAGLFALRDELRRPRSARIEWDCRFQGCPGGAELAERITPLDPGWVLGPPFVRCPEDRWCVGVGLPNPGCGAWSTELRMDGVETDRLVSARIGGFVGALACGEMEMNEPQPGG